MALTIRRLLGGAGLGTHGELALDAANLLAADLVAAARQGRHNSATLWGDLAKNRI